MASDPDCVFCKIVAGKIPCVKLYEDDQTLAFMDINPVHDGHCLVIPKAHHATVFELPAACLAAAGATAIKIANAVNAAIRPDGLNLLQANGPAVPGPMAGLLGDLRQADVKGDGVIALDAYLAQQSKRFDDLDRNKDGTVDAADFDLLRKDMTDYQVKRFLHAYGADAQGKISKDQFYKVAKERFARLDPKGEGRITIGRGGEHGGRMGRGGPMGGRGMDMDRMEQGGGQDDGPDRKRN